MAQKLCSPCMPGLSTAAWDKDVFRESSQKFLLFWGSLETYFEEDKLFSVKPKAHQLFELARAQVNPSKTWTYRDESYGHTLALLGKTARWQIFDVCCFLSSPQTIPGS